METNEDTSGDNSTPKPQNSGNKALQTTEVSAEDEPQSRLLALPPELRIEIYRFCVVNDGYATQIDDEYKLPPLLSTCRQIRQESIELWCMANEFEMDLDIDTSLYRAWITRIIRPLDLEDIFYVATFLGNIGWRYIVEWCRAVWTEEHEPLEAPSHLDSDWALIHAAQNIAFQSRGLAWEKVVSQPEGLKAVAGYVDDLSLGDEP